MSVGSPLGEVILKDFGLSTEGYWYWIGLGALFGYTVIFNFLFTLFLTYLNRELLTYFSFGHI